MGIARNNILTEKVLIVDTNILFMLYSFIL